LGTSSGNKKSREKIHHKKVKIDFFSFRSIFLVKKSSGKSKGFFPPRIPGEN